MGHIMREGISLKLATANGIHTEDTRERAFLSQYDDAMRLAVALKTLSLSALQMPGMFDLTFRCVKRSNHK